MNIYYLKNKTNGEIVDVGAESLYEAKYKAAMFLGGQPDDYFERF